jgi:hypothetical protein
MDNTFLPVMAILPFRTVLTFLTFLTLGAILTFLTLGALLTLRELLAFRNLLAIGIIAIARVIAIVVIAILIVLILILIIALILDGRLSLGRKNDSIIMLGVLEIVFSDHAVTGALCIPCKRRIFFGDVLSISPDFDIRTVALVVTG